MFANARTAVWAWPAFCGSSSFDHFDKLRGGPQTDRSSATVLREGLPRPVVPDECIEDGEEFAHSCDKRDLGTLTAVAQASVEGLQIGRAHV